MFRLPLVTPTVIHLIIMSCFIEGCLAAALFDPSVNYSSLPTGPMSGFALPAEISLLVIVASGDQQFSCRHLLHLENTPYVILGLHWSALFREYYLSVGLYVSVAPPFVFDSDLVSCDQSSPARSPVFRNHCYVARQCPCVSVQQC